MRRIRAHLWTLLLTLVLPLVLHPEEVPEATVEDVPPLVMPEIRPQDTGTISPVYGPSAGTHLNLEPHTSARQQHIARVDLLRNRVAAGVELIVGAATDLRRPGGSASGYYVSRDRNSPPEIEGGLPVITARSSFFGLGDPGAVANPARDVVFMADSRISLEEARASSSLLLVAIEQRLSLSGRFHVIWNGEPRYVLIDDQGQWIELLLDEAAVKPLGGPLSFNRQRVKIEGEKVDAPSGRVRVLSISIERKEP